MEIKTEYQRCFKHDPSLTQNYKELLCLRNKRKNFNHHHTPITWDSSDYEEENETVCIAEKKSKINSIHDIDQNVVITRSLSRSRIPSTPLKEISTQTKVISTRNIGTQSPSKSIRKTRLSKDKSDFTFKPIKRKIALPKKSTPKIKKSRSCLIQKAPIIAYGWADNTSIQEKKTFNVRAPATQVRSTALQAEKIRELRKKTKLTKKERLAQEKLKREAVIDSLTNFNQWQTEYQKQFCKL